jgi:hypothetical protein
MAKVNTGTYKVVGKTSGQGAPKVFGRVGNLEDAENLRNAVRALAGFDVYTIEIKPIEFSVHTPEACIASAMLASNKAELKIVQAQLETCDDPAIRPGLRARKAELFAAISAAKDVDVITDEE